MIGITNPVVFVECGFAGLTCGVCMSLGPKHVLTARGKMCAAVIFARAVGLEVSGG